MVDQARWIGACEAGLPWDQGTFARIYLGHRGKRAAELIGEDAVASALLTIMRLNAEWYIEPSLALGALAAKTDELTQRAKAWPSTTIALRAKLQRLEQPLRHAGLVLDLDARKGSSRKKRVRCWKFWWETPPWGEGDPPVYVTKLLDNTRAR